MVVCCLYALLEGNAAGRERESRSERAYSVEIKEIARTCSSRLPNGMRNMQHKQLFSHDILVYSSRGGYPARVYNIRIIRTTDIIKQQYAGVMLCDPSSSMCISSVAALNPILCLGCAYTYVHRKSRKLILLSHESTLKPSLPSIAFIYSDRSTQGAQNLRTQRASCTQQPQPQQPQ